MTLIFAWDALRARRSTGLRQVVKQSALVGLACLLGCAGRGDGKNSGPLSAEEQQELEKLRAENQEIKKLTAQNQELERLRKDNQELLGLRRLQDEIRRLGPENAELRAKLASIPAAKTTMAALYANTNNAVPEPLVPIQDLPVAFSEAATIVAAGGNFRPEDVPQKGDNILIDQSVIGLLIPEFAKNTNGGNYEVSGWLAAKGVVLTNYQQLNVLGITNYFIRRAPPPLPDSAPK